MLLFCGVANIMLSHHNSFAEVVQEIERNELFCKPQEALWQCLGCGNILSGFCALTYAHLGYPQSYYRLLSFYKVLRLCLLCSKLSIMFIINTQSLLYFIYISIGLW